MKNPSFPSLFLKKVKSIFSVLGIITILMSIMPSTVFALQQTVSGHTVSYDTAGDYINTIYYDFGGGGLPLNYDNPDAYVLSPGMQAPEEFTVTGNTVGLDYGNQIVSCGTNFELVTNFGEVERTFTIERNECGGEHGGSPIPCAALVEGDSNTDVKFWFVQPGDGVTCSTGDKVSFDTPVSPDPGAPTYWTAVFSNRDYYSIVATPPSPPYVPTSEDKPLETYPQLNGNHDVSILRFGRNVDDGDTLYFFMPGPGGGGWGNVTIDAVGAGEGEEEVNFCAVLANGTSDDDIRVHLTLGNDCVADEKINLNEQIEGYDFSWWDGWLGNPSIYSVTDPGDDYPSLSATGPSVGPTLNNDGTVVSLHFNNPVNAGPDNFYFYDGVSAWESTFLIPGEVAPPDSGDDFFNEECFSFTSQETCLSLENDPACW